MNSREILVTGGYGFIGSAVANELADLGHRVTAVDIQTLSFRNDVRYIELDISNSFQVLDVCKNIDSVIHCASVVQTSNVGRGRIWQVNFDGTKNILNACKTHKISRLVHISSASVIYEGIDIKNGDENHPYAQNPGSAYVESKLAAEQAVGTQCQTSATQTCILRPHLVFGPDDRRFIPNILQRARDGKLNRKIDVRSKLSDFTYISNLVDAIVLAEEKLGSDPSVNGQVFFITNGEPIPFFEFVEEFLAQLGYPPIKRKVPYWLAYTGAALIEMFNALRFQEPQPETGISRFAVKYQATDHYFCIDKARKELGWEPKIPLTEGIRLTADAFRA